MAKSVKITAKKKRKITFFVNIGSFILFSKKPVIARLDSRKYIIKSKTGKVKYRIKFKRGSAKSGRFISMRSGKR